MDFKGVDLGLFLEGGEGVQVVQLQLPSPSNEINNFGLKRRYIAKILRQLQQLAAFIVMGE